jgi:mRNA-degrading endonuclease RelE of RelBE toxin-antitoxin system
MKKILFFFVLLSTFFIRSVYPQKPKRKLLTFDLKQITTSGKKVIKGRYELFRIETRNRETGEVFVKFYEFYDSATGLQSQVNIDYKRVSAIKLNVFAPLMTSYMQSKEAEELFGNRFPSLNFHYFEGRLKFISAEQENITKKEDDLLHAIAYKKPEAAAEALAQGANASVMTFDKKSGLYLTPLFLAAMHGDVAIAQQLKDHGAQLDFRTPQGLTALFQAAEAEREKFVLFLLNNGASIETEGPEGQSLLEFFVFKNNLKMVTALLEKGANINHKNPQFNVPLIVRIAAFAELDDTYKPMNNLLKTALLESTQPKKEQPQKQKDVKEEQASEPAKKPSKPKKAPTHCDSAQASNQEFEKLRAQQEEEEQKAEQVRLAIEKANRLARHEKSTQDKEKLADSPTASTATAAAPYQPAQIAKQSFAPFADYSVMYSEKAHQQRNALLETSPGEKIVKTIDEKIQAYKDGEKKDVKTVISKSSKETLWRLRVGDKRVFFKQDNEKKEIVIVGIEDRDDAY